MLVNLLHELSNDYCMLIRINIEHHVAHVHTQNGLAKSLIKGLQLITRPLLKKTKLPASTLGHVVMRATSLIRIRPTSYHEYFTSQLVLDKQQNNCHLRIFGCAEITPTQPTKIGPNEDL